MSNLARYASGMDDLVAPSWNAFMRVFRREWKAGEHVLIYGETGSGKTDMGFHLLNTEPFAVGFITKPRDPIFRSSLTRGYRRMREWPPKDVKRGAHFLLNAKPGKTMDAERESQRALFPSALDSIYRDGGWTVLFDEAFHMSTSLGMKQQVSDFFFLGRSYDLTGIACTQRPRHIPVVLPQSCKWAFMGRSRRDDDIATLSELGYSKQELKARLTSLRNIHDFLFVDPQGKLPLAVVNTHA
jgi:energy-coupling factor transporter ATP-binding protein EcfA2